MSKWVLSLLACATMMSLLSSSAVAREPAKVLVDLSDGSDGRMSVKLSPSTIAPGPVEFTVKNESGNTVHEFMFAKWGKRDDALPYDRTNRQVEEDKIPGLQGIEDLRPHETVTAQFTLSEGRYIVFCNEPGHYRAGVRADVVVNAAK